MCALETQLRIPDLWQQEALRSLQSGEDVVVAAPTGAGKTYIFELLVEAGFEGKAVYTVPTRALANDKRLEWQRRGWDVGIETGDRSENREARVIVATLETQKGKLIRGEGPDLLVIDEYQMLGDHQRGLNYELSIAQAPATTQLLLMSGSVANPNQVVDWLSRLGRKACLIRHLKRPVPLEEIHIDGLPDNIPLSVKGFWPRGIARVLKAGMAPLLTFAPQRKAAEDLAFDIARMLPEEDPLVLTPEQEKLAGSNLKRLLRARVAYHHSGLDYSQRASLIEPLAKAGQLRVVVATMGLASGINFSMRSVLVTSREYRSGESIHQVRPDELLQMFGRAGRRGMDKVGFIAIAKGKPRMQEARSLRLKRSNQVDWPSLIGVMQQSIESSRDPVQDARSLTSRLFSIQRISLGLAQFQESGPASIAIRPRIISQNVVEFQTPDGDWQRKKAPRTVELEQCLILKGHEWQPALSVPDCLAELKMGTLCRLGNGKAHLYGRMVPVARFGQTEREGEMVLNRWLVKALRDLNAKGRRRWHRYGWTLDQIESRLIRFLPQVTHGGKFHEWRERNGMLYSVLNYSNALTYAQMDSKGRALIAAQERTVTHQADLSLSHDASSQEVPPARSAADIWYSLGLIDGRGAPTRRGILFSFFNYGEGLAIAAALEDASYAIEDLVYDLANLRAGHRFGEYESSSSRMGAVCQSTYGLVTYPGYLTRGIPPTYGEGAAEALFQPGVRQALLRQNSELHSGDIERVRLEWRSLIRHVAHAPYLNDTRWIQLQQAARKEMERFPREATLENLPQLTSIQRKRHKSFLNFEHSAVNG